jgi:hypothetical protein
MPAVITSSMATGDDDVSDSKIAEWPRPQGEKEIRDLLERARGGDASDLAALREALKNHPEIWRAYGDLAAHAREAWINLIGGVDVVLKESLGRQIEAMKIDLAGPDPSPLETLLVERIAACWLQMGYSDAVAAGVGNISIQQANYNRKRQDSAHRRYLSALATLAMTRRLLGLAAGATGAMAKTSLASTGPAKVVGDDLATEELGEPRTTVSEGNRAEDGRVLEFRPTLADLPGDGQRGPRRRSRGSSRT